MVVKDKTGVVSTPPVRVFNRFNEVKLLCAYGNEFGDSIVCGFPSLREKLAVASAGYVWLAEQ